MSIKRLFWDIETSPNIGTFWRSGYKLSIPHDNIIQERAIICISYKWEGKKRVRTLRWNKGDDRKLCEDFAPIAAEADEMVAHNGDRFDLRWFNTRNLINGLPPLPAHKTVDTLKIAKSKFYFNSNKLDYIAKILCGRGKKATDYGMWKDILLRNDKKAMDKMVAYCEDDVVLLEEVWKALQPYAPNKSHAGVLSDKENWTCPHDGSYDVHTSKTTTTSRGTVQFQMRCNKCGRYYTISNKAHNDYLER